MNRKSLNLPGYKKLVTNKTNGDSGVSPTRDDVKMWLESLSDVSGEDVGNPIDELLNDISTIKQTTGTIIDPLRGLEVTSTGLSAEIFDKTAKEIMRLNDISAIHQTLELVLLNNKGPVFQKLI